MSCYIQRGNSLSHPGPFIKVRINTFCTYHKIIDNRGRMISLFRLLYHPTDTDDNNKLPFKRDIEVILSGVQKSIEFQTPRKDYSTRNFIGLQYV